MVDDVIEEYKTCQVEPCTNLRLCQGKECKILQRVEQNRCVWQKVCYNQNKNIIVIGLWEDVVLDLTVFLFREFGIIWLVIQDIECFLLVQYFLRSFKPTCITFWWNWHLLVYFHIFHLERIFGFVTVSINVFYLRYMYCLRWISMIISYTSSAIVILFNAKYSYRNEIE